MEEEEWREDGRPPSSAKSQEGGVGTASTSAELKEPFPVLSGSSLLPDSLLPSSFVSSPLPPPSAALMNGLSTRESLVRRGKSRFASSGRKAEESEDAEEKGKEREKKKKRTRGAPSKVLIASLYRVQ